MKNRSAFTLIELVLVIVILGIVSSLAMGRMDRDLQQEAASTILSHIRLAQQLALSDNKHQSGDNDWYTRYWKMEYTECDDGGYFYRIGSRSTDSLRINDKIESAIDPVDNKYIWADESCTVETDTSKNVLLTKKFGIVNIESDGGCGSYSSTFNDIGFDYLGRPHTGIAQSDTDNFSTLMHDDCNLTFTLSMDQDNNGENDIFIIIVKAETGYSFIVGGENL